MRKEKGITLIALIITIIVMLILVAVTISVALNGGIFNNAREAKTGTQRQAEKEELIAKMVGAYDSTGSFATSNVGQLPSGAQWCTEEETSYEHAVSNPTSDTNWIITKNGNKFYIDESGSVLDEKPAGTSIEYYHGLLTNTEMIVVVNYEAGNIKTYNSNLTLNTTVPGLSFTSGETVTININNQSTTINCTGVYYNNILVACISNKKIYLLDENSTDAVMVADWYNETNPSRFIDDDD